MKIFFSHFSSNSYFFGEAPQITENRRRGSRQRIQILSTIMVIWSLCFTKNSSPPKWLTENCIFWIFLFANSIFSSSQGRWIGWQYLVEDKRGFYQIIFFPLPRPSSNNLTGWAEDVTQRFLSLTSLCVLYKMFGILC